MPDTIGNITVPAISISGTAFPLVSDYPWGRVHAPEIVEHLIGNQTANLKITQRFLLGNGAKRFTVHKASINEADRVALRNFWENRSGPYEGFVYNCPNEAGTSTTAFNVRFANEPLSWQFVAQYASQIGLNLIEIPSTSPTYTLNSTVTRFPSSTLKTGLLAQVQQVIPLVKITVTEAGYPVIYLSHRRCTVGSQLYLARLVDWDGIQQSIDGAADDATFTFGNADRVMRDLSNDTDLFRASVEFSLFHVGTGIKLDLWKGDVADWSFDVGPEFKVRAVDGLYEINLPYPTRRVSRTCWKDFNDGISCPAAANGGLHLGDPCDKGFETALGCAYHNMQQYFGGIVAKPQAVRTKDNSNSGMFGFGRSPLTTSSLIADSIYDEVVPEVYTDRAFPVNGKIVAGREEGDFYTALAILCEGPIGGMDPGLDIEGNPRNHLLDGQTHHGPGNLGLRRGFGEDPARTFDPDPDSDKFSLGEGGAGIQTYGTERAAGTAFIEIRRNDPKGLQLSQLVEHQVQGWISSGLEGWVWTAPGTRTFQASLTNGVWISVNVMLRARGLRAASAATAESYFDVVAAIAAAAIWDTSVASLVDGSSETQFKFIGIIQQERALRDWVTDILMNGLSYFTFSFGKLRIGVRNNSSVVEAFTEGNIIHGSLRLAPIKPAFNHLIANFADQEFDFVGNAQLVYDIDYAKKIGGATSPLFIKSTLPLTSGTPTKSQAGRNAAVRLREELGGIYRPDRPKPYLEFTAARQIAFSTTFLALNAEAGQVCSLTHEDMPTYQASNDGQAETANYGEFRIERIRWKSDFSIDIEGRTTHNDMYDLTVGPKPADVVADDIPGEQEFAPADWGFTALTRGDGILRLREFTCATNPATVHRGFFDVYYIPEERNSYARITADVGSGAAAIDYEGETPIVGEWLLLESEIMLVTSVTPADSNSGTCTVARGQLGTSAVAHNRVTTSVSAKVTNADITVGSGLALKPGNRLFTDPAGAQRTIAEYVSATGVTRLTLPFGTINVADDVYSDPRIFRVSLRNEIIDFQPRFFKSPNRAEFEYQVNMPFSGVVAVRGILENTRGIQSEEVIELFTASFPNRLRTLGTTQYSLVHPALPTGTNDDVFESIKTAHGQSFETAYAEIVSAEQTGDPLPIPRAVSAISLTKKLAGGSISIGGTIAAGGRIHVTIGDGTEKTFVDAPVFEITTETTAAQVATSLAVWLNATDEFAAFFKASAVSAAVNITDLAGLGGTIGTDVSGAVTASPTGLISWLAIFTGRKYAVSFHGAAGDSDLSPLSISTGPTGGASQIEIKDVPESTDARMTASRVYAAPDGKDSPFYLIGTASGGIVVDTVTEGSLTGQTPYPGAGGPTQAGEIKATVNIGGDPWFEVRIPDSAARSNVVDGIALGNIAAGAILTADVLNGATEQGLKVVFH